MVLQSPEPAGVQAIGETIVGGVLMTAPFWVRALVELNLVVASITGLCGLLIAVNGVWRIFNRRERS